MTIRMLSEALGDEGYAVVTANGGQAGIDAFQSALAGSSPFSVVITDLAMHVVDGLQVAKALKSILPFTPVILLTGWGEWFGKQTGLPIQVDCVLTKPVKVAELKAAMVRCMKLACC